MLAAICGSLTRMQGTRLTASCTVCTLLPAAANIIPEAVCGCAKVTSSDSKPCLASSMGAIVSGELGRPWGIAEPMPRIAAVGRKRERNGKHAWNGNWGNNSPKELPDADQNNLLHILQPPGYDSSTAGGGSNSSGDGSCSSSSSGGSCGTVQDNGNSTEAGVRLYGIRASANGTTAYAVACCSLDTTPPVAGLAGGLWCSKGVKCLKKGDLQGKMLTLCRYAFVVHTGKSTESNSKKSSGRHSESTESTSKKRSKE